MSSDENSSTSKRTRASGEALDYLLQEFEHNHNPTTEQRKEISERTGMAEKAVRIWFQNRRAKLRKFERMNRLTNGTSSIHSSRSNSFSNISPIHPNHLQQAIPIEVNEKYCFIDCSSLSVGSWQRIKSGFHDERSLKNNLVNLSPFTLNSVMNNVDLLVILSKKNFEINYFFSAVSNNSKILFRIFYPISSIVTCSLLDNNINKENNELRVSLSHQPKFSVFFFNGVNSQSNQWSICDDFSEGQQVSQAYVSEGGTSIPHVLVGVKNSLQYLNSFILENIQLYANGTANGISLPQPPAAAPEYRQPQHQFPDDKQSHNQDSFQFTTEDLLWDETSSLAPTSTNRSTTPAPYPHSSTASVSNGHLRNTQLNVFSPLADFTSETSPNSIGSNNSNMHQQGPQPHHHQHQQPQHNQNNQSSQYNFNSSANTPHSVSSGQNVYSRHSVPQQQNIPETHSVDGYDVFNTANTPDFFTTISGEGHTPSNVLSHDQSPSIQLQGPSIPVTNNTTTSSVHAYTHQNNNHHDLLDSNSAFPQSHEFDFPLNGTNDFTSNSNTPLSGAFDNQPQGSNSGGNSNNGNNGGASSNVDSFIDYGSN
ncbi:uncharacterized protein RJT20DRAFT_134218 [Scheffersomyces xylosifermentans]|uniref:uncharacterized protein n=1 Tax=Scheffersomyces xylosifermentans TaxID=1304137 RepID=UPI00315D484C